MEATTILEKAVRDMVAQALAAQAPVNLMPLSKFCTDKGISRTTVWRAEKRGELQLTRIGTRIFVNLQQFTTK
jgi:hypothetical protein